MLGYRRTKRGLVKIKSHSKVRIDDVEKGTQRYFSTTEAADRYVLKVLCNAIASNHQVEDRFYWREDGDCYSLGAHTLDQIRSKTHVVS